MLPFRVLVVVTTVLVFGTSARRMRSPTKATRTPCCQDTLGSAVCRTMYNRDHERFALECRNNPDFSFLQCCMACHFNHELYTSLSVPSPPDLYIFDAQNMLLAEGTPHCFDRHGEAFCSAFVHRASHWRRTPHSCNHSALAFRLCRKSCGYCSASPGVSATTTYNSDIARNIKQCAKLY